MAGGQVITTGQGNVWPQKHGIVAFLGQGNVGVNVSVALTGIAITSAQGLIAAYSGDVNAALSGQEAVVGQGSVAPAQQLTGQAITTGQGSVTQSAAVALTGQAITSAQGTLGTGQEAEDTLIQSGQGSVVADRSIALTGIAITAAQGTITPTGDVDEALTGSAITLAQGSVTQSASVQLVGAQINALQGPIGTEGGVLEPEPDFDPVGDVTTAYREDQGEIEPLSEEALAALIRADDEIILIVAAALLEAA